MNNMDNQQESQPLPDTASPYDVYAPEPHTGWGRLIPINCTLAAKDLTDNMYAIGREKKCQVSFTEYDIDRAVFKQISKVHCKITREKISQDDDYIVFLQDLSSNGTYVNEVKVGKNERTIITSDDEISLVNPQNKVFFFVDSAKDKIINWMPQNLSTKYHLLKHLGTGGFAEVKLVLDKRTCLKRAVKRLNKNGMEDPKVTNEITILKNLRHPCIVEMVDFVDSKDAAFLVMEFVPNGNLLERLRKGLLSEPLAKLVFFQLTWAVDYLHGQGISHRDLKPENILISDKQNNLMIVKLADFGLSKVINSMTQLRTACGTLTYTAPEVLVSRGKAHYTNKVDIWGLGVVLFVCLSGRRPFLSKADDEPGVLIERILRGNYTLRTPEWKKVSIIAKLLVSRLLTVKPENRPSSQEVLGNTWLKDPELAQGIRTLFGQAAPIKENEEMCVEEPAPKLPRLQEIIS